MKHILCLFGRHAWGRWRRVPTSGTPWPAAQRRFCRRSGCTAVETRAAKPKRIRVRTNLNPPVTAEELAATYFDFDAVHSVPPVDMGQSP